MSIRMVTSSPSRTVLPMSAGIRLYPQIRAGSFKSSLLLGSFISVQPRMSAAAAEPAAPEPQGTTAAPDSSTTAPTPAAPIPDATADPIVSGVLNRFIRQYETKDTAEQAVFDDNLFHVTGTPNIKVQFHAVAKLFKTCKITIQESSVEPVDESLAAKFPGGRVIKVYNLQDYTVASKEIQIKCDTTITIDANGKIVDHVDKWRDRWANFSFLKRAGGSATSALMKAVKY